MPFGASTLTLVATLNILAMKPFRDSIMTLWFSDYMGHKFQSSYKYDAIYKGLQCIIQNTKGFVDVILN